MHARSSRRKLGAAQIVANHEESGPQFVESVFAWPGLGSLAAGAVGTRDYPLLMGTALLVSSLIVLGGLLTDVTYGVLDPRIRWA